MPATAMRMATSRDSSLAVLVAPGTPADFAFLRRLPSSSTVAAAAPERREGAPPADARALDAPDARGARARSAPPEGRAGRSAVSPALRGRGAPCDVRSIGRSGPFGGRLFAAKGSP